MITQDQLPMLANASMNNFHLEDMILINKLSNAVQNQDTDVVGATLEELIIHSKEHFSQEEVIMSEKNVASSDKHKAEHSRILHELNSVLDRFKQEKDLHLVRAYVEGSLSSWMLHHVQTLDSEL